jgi:hypothetical protein
MPNEPKRFRKRMRTFGLTRPVLRFRPVRLPCRMGFHLVGSSASGMIWELHLRSLRSAEVHRLILARLFIARGGPFFELNRRGSDILASRLDHAAVHAPGRRGSTPDRRRQVELRTRTGPDWSTDTADAAERKSSGRRQHPVDRRPPNGLRSFYRKAVAVAHLVPAFEAGQCGQRNQ